VSYTSKELGNDVALELLERATDPILGKDVTVKKPNEKVL